MNLIFLNREFYNAFAEDFSESRETINEGIKRSLASLDLSRVIDAGRGDGRVSRLIPSTSFYVGADFSERLIGRAAAHGSFLWRSRQPLPFAPQSFSAVVRYAALHHLPDRLSPWINGKTFTTGWAWRSRSGSSHTWNGLEKDRRRFGEW